MPPSQAVNYSWVSKPKLFYAAHFAELLRAEGRPITVVPKVGQVVLTVNPIGVDAAVTRLNEGFDLPLH